MATLEITTKIGCGMACTYCPQDKLSQAYGSSAQKLLTFDTFKAVIDKLPPHVRIDFSGMSEPFENTECMDFIRYASGKKNPICIYTTLAGLKRCDLPDFVRLIKVKRISTVVIHMPDQNGNMRGWKFSEDYLEALNEILPLDNVSCMTMSHDGSLDKEVSERLRGLTNYKIFKKKLPSARFIGWTRAGSLNRSVIDKNGELENEVRWKRSLTCSFTPFYDHNVLLPDGRVVLCCMDYSLKHVIGNLMNTSYYDLFKGSEIAKVRNINMMTNAADKPECICSQCTKAITYEPTDGCWIDQDSRVSLKKSLEEVFHRVRAGIATLI